MNKDQLDEIWRRLGKGETIAGTAGRTNGDGDDEITVGDKGWRRKKGTPDWDEVPPWRGNLDPQKTIR